METIKHNKNFILICVSLLLYSCGFHFRGAIVIPDVMQEISLEGNIGTNDLGQIISRRFIQLGINEVTDKTQISTVLIIHKNVLTKRVLTVDNASKASAYKLDLNIEFSVIDKHKKVLLKKQTVRQTREYNVDPDNTLASGDQEAQLKKNMIEFVVNQILTRMSIVLRQTAKTK